MSQAARPPEAGEFGLAWPGEPTGLAGLASWLQAGPGTTLAIRDATPTRTEDDTIQGYTAAYEIKRMADGETGEERNNHNCGK